MDTNKTFEISNPLDDNLVNDLSKKCNTSWSVSDIPSDQTSDGNNSSSDESDDDGSCAHSSSLAASACAQGSKQQTYLDTMLQHSGAPQNINKLNIEHSKNVHIGNVTVINGPIQITHYGDQPTVKSADFLSSKSEVKALTKSPVHLRSTNPNVINSNKSVQSDNAEEEEPLEQNNSKFFLGPQHHAIDTTVLRIVHRRTWLAQPPLVEPELLSTPVSHVIISHTATETGTTQAELVYLVRIIQCFHIESRKFNDIAYNFLIGGDGNVYEGRGWNKVGAHTLGYNRRAIGISFVGCFMNLKPTKESLAVCQALIRSGISLGYIAPDYKLLAHCQCCPTESPGRMLFDEIKQWPHWENQQLTQ